MKPQSAKAKGRRFQQWIRDKIIETFPNLTKRDVRSTGMGQGGSDIQLSEVAHRLFPYDVEAKAREDFKRIYDIYQQAQEHGDSEPIVFIRSNSKPPLVIFAADHFFKLIEDNNEQDN